MPSWTPGWIASALAILGLENTERLTAILRAWQASTPLPPESNNPLGMPAGLGGAKPWHGTAYASFATMDDFFAALMRFAASYAGRGLMMTLSEDARASTAWNAIAALGWPAGKTETDFPAAILDMTSDGYRESIGAADPKDRKTSGIVHGSADTSPSVSAMSARLTSGLAGMAPVSSGWRNHN